jgi:hypothetical protein
VLRRHFALEFFEHARALQKKWAPGLGRPGAVNLLSTFYRR